MTLPLFIDRVEAFVFRAPISKPVQTSFGKMHDRPAVFVRVTNAQGLSGWGEIWCNFPAVGAEHRARLVKSVFREKLERQKFATPLEAFEVLTASTEVLAIQSAEPGPIGQCIAGLDIALWDLAAKQVGQPLWQYLGGTQADIAVYASGLNPTEPELLAAQQYAQGHRAFKLKVGFGADKDLGNLQALRSVLGPQALMVDANQAWTLETALAMAPKLARFDLQWLEEPLRADRSPEEWLALSSASNIALAAGENMAGQRNFAKAIASGAFRVLQPDLAKWGGFSGCVPVAKAIRQSGLRFCPHYLGAGIGLLASAHWLAAVGGEGMLEIDANDNPLRTLTCGPLNQVQEGRASLNDLPGLGLELDLHSLKPFSVPY